MYARGRVSESESESESERIKMKMMMMKANGVNMIKQSVTTLNLIS